MKSDNNNSQNRKDASFFYRQKTLQRKRGYAEMFEASSIGDLAFLLLIFFIVTSSFMLRQGIFLSLPSSTAGSVQVDPKKLVSIYPTNEGFILESISINRKELIKVLKEKNKKTSGTIVIIYMNNGVKYDRLVDALSVVKESGITKVSLKDGGEG